MDDSGVVCVCECVEGWGLWLTSALLAYKSNSPHATGVDEAFHFSFVCVLLDKMHMSTLN